MSTNSYFKELQKLKYRDETNLVSDLISNHQWISEKIISQNAEEIVSKCRQDRNKTRLDNFFLEYGLSNQEGIALMCLAESLLRIPDNETCDEIIEEKIGGKKWLDHFNSSPSLFVNAKTGTLGLALDINSAVNPLLVSTTMALASIFFASFTDVAARVCQSLSCFKLLSK